MKKIAFILLVVLILIVTSCSSVTGLYNSIKTGYPFWYFQPSSMVGTSEVPFVVSAQGETQRQAELLAYEELGKKISLYVGRDLKPENIRELITLDHLDELGLTVLESYSVLEDTLYTVSLLASAKKDVITPLRTQQAIDRENVEAQIISLILEGDEYIKNNEDIKGVENYIKSLVLSYGNTLIDQEYSFDAILSEVLDILNSIEIRVLNPSTSKVTAKISVRRKVTVIASRVSECPIKATYYAVGSNGQSYQDSFTYMTEENGQVNFEVLNSSIEKKGSIIFSIGLDEVLENLKKVSEKDYYKIKAVIDNRSVKFDYNKAYNMGFLGVSFLQYERGAVFEDGVRITNILSDKFNTDGIACLSYPVLEEMTESQLIDAFNKGKGYKHCFLLIKAEVTDDQDSLTGKHYVLVEGQADLFDEKANVLYSTGQVSASGFGDSYESAKQNAMDRLSEVAYILIKEAYV